MAFDIENGSVLLIPKITGNGTTLAEGHTSVSVVGGVTLASAEYQNRMIDLTGALVGNVTVIFPLVDGSLWYVFNSTTGAFTVTCIGSSGTGVIIGQGKRAVIASDGTNINRWSADN